MLSGNSTDAKTNIDTKIDIDALHNTLNNKHEDLHVNELDISYNVDVGVDDDELDIGDTGFEIRDYDNVLYDDVELICKPRSSSIEKEGSN